MNTARADALRTVSIGIIERPSDGHDDHGVGGHQVRPYGNDFIGRMPTCSL